jgi:hypothetical protein
MIRINLLKNATEKRRPGGPRIRKFLGAGGVLAGAALMGVCGFWGYQWYGARSKQARPEVKRIVSQDLAPSSYANANMVEEVVKEVNDSRLKLRESGVLDLPYDQLSFSEKINYELLFTKDVCEMLSRIIPGGIGLKSLEINDFQTIYAVGLGPSRDVIETMLTSLKNEKVTVLPPPYSFVKPAGKDGYRFAFSCKTQFGLNLTDPLVDGSLARLPSREAITTVFDTFGKLAGKNNITITKAPTQASCEKFGNYYRSLYQWSGTSSYKDFVKFVLSLYDAKLMGALKRCALVAQSAKTVKIESQIIVTTKE